ncbi:MAG: hypothetical protein WDZ35_00910 [Crocinitomicaceae bacterium]
MSGNIRNQILILLYEGELNDKGIFEQFELPIGIFYKLLRIAKNQGLVTFKDSAMANTFKSDYIYPPGVNIDLKLTTLGKEWTKKYLIDKENGYVDLGGSDMLDILQIEKAGMRISHFENLTYEEYRKKFPHIAGSARMDNRMLYYIMTGKKPNLPSIAEKKEVELTVEWLEGYSSASKYYNDAIERYDKLLLDRYLMDDLRKCVEFFLKDFFGNNVSLENQGKNIKGHLKNSSISSYINALYGDVLKRFVNYQNDSIKHGDKFNSLEIDFILEISTSLMKMLLRTKEAE